jgi:hypothetical protein
VTCSCTVPQLSRHIPADAVVYVIQVSWARINKGTRHIYIYTCIYIYIYIYLFVCFPGVTTHCGCIFHSPVVGFSLLVFEVS